MSAPKRVRQKRPSELYVSNAQFSEAVAAYVRERERASSEGRPAPVVPDYIADCIHRIAKGLARHWRFNRYTYREEMIMDGVENCLRYITRFNPSPSKTATGRPNAFAYFTQVCFHAFVNRIKKEKRQQDIKTKMMKNADVRDYFGAIGDDEMDSNLFNALDSHLAEIKRNADLAFDKEQDAETAK